MQNYNIILCDTSTFKVKCPVSGAKNALFYPKQIWQSLKLVAVHIVQKINPLLRENNTAFTKAYPKPNQ